MKYYLSIVATSRNDNHGGDLIQRTSAFVNSVFVQAKKWNFPVELILVEWNPPEENVLLHEVLPKPQQDDLVTLKYVVVPREIHNKYIGAKKIPLYQMIAKNAGIRRADGEYILCTNIDIIFSDECFQIFAERKFQPNNFYRANRCDIPKEVMEIEDFNNSLQYARENILNRLGKAPGHETLALPRFVYFFPNLSRFINYFILKLWKATHKNKFPHFLIDFDACGDFTLMSKQDWMDIEGYVELDMYSIHVDSMALWAAAALGKKQIIFPYKACVYHIDHENGWESEDILKTIKFLESKSCLDYSIVHKGGLYIVERKQHWNLNKPDWGFANEKFKEYIFAPGKEMTEIN